MYLMYLIIMPLDKIKLKLKSHVLLYQNKNFFSINPNNNKFPNNLEYY